MAKNAQRLGNDGFSPTEMSYEQALKSLDSDRYDEGPVWLGLDRNIMPVSLRLSKSYSGVIGHSMKHCFFVSHGTRDNYGTPSTKKIWNAFSRFFQIGTNLRIVP